MDMKGRWIYIVPMLGLLYAFDEGADFDGFVLAFRAQLAWGGALLLGAVIAAWQ